MDPVAAVTAISTALANVSAELTQRSSEYNTPAMQNALVIHRLQAELDAQRAAIAAEDLEAVRLMLAEAD